MRQPTTGVAITQDLSWVETCPASVVLADKLPTPHLVIAPSPHQEVESENITAGEMTSNPWFELLTNIDQSDMKNKIQDGCAPDPPAAREKSTISKIPKTELVRHQENASISS
jgi:hypothetical protein